MYFTEPTTFVILSDSIAKHVELDTADVLAYRGASIGEVTYNMDKDKDIIDGYSCIVFHVGTNDIFRLSVDKFMSAYCNLISSAKRLFPGVDIGMSSIIPRPVDFQKTNPKITKINKRLSELCLKMKVHFIHSYRVFLKGGKPLVELYGYRDSLHLNVEGSRLLGLYLRKRVDHFQ